MKKILASLMIVLSFGLVTVSASSSCRRIEVIPCPNCGGSVYVTRIKEYKHLESFPCKHYSKGYDIYKVYEISDQERCGSCGYHSKSKIMDQHDFNECKGYN